MEILTVILLCISCVFIIVASAKPNRLLNYTAIGVSTLGFLAALIDTSVTEEEQTILTVLMIVLVLISGTMLLTDRK